MKLRFIFLAILILGGCTHGNVSKIPLYIEGVGKVYRYTGRANFSHQFAAADRMIAEYCKELSGGQPIIVNIQNRDLGVVAVGSGSSNTNASATASGGAIYGTSSTTSNANATALRNQNQEVLFKCLEKQ